MILNYMGNYVKMNIRRKLDSTKFLKGMESKIRFMYEERIIAFSKR